MNLLKETKKVMSWSGYTIDDIAWVGCDSFRIPIDVFIKCADTKYDNGFGAPEVAQDLVIVLRDGSWMERTEYDGRERWDLKSTPRMPDEVWDGAVALTVRQVDGASCGWENLGVLCALAERGE